jgi:hypothetical protein
MDSRAYPPYLKPNVLVGFTGSSSDCQTSLCVSSKQPYPVQGFPQKLVFEGYSCKTYYTIACLCVISATFVSLSLHREQFLRTIDQHRLLSSFFILTLYIFLS